VTRGEPRYVRFRLSRCQFLPVTRVCLAAIPSVAPHHRRFYPSVHSEDQRARVEGPSEGRVPIRMQRCPVPASGSYAYGGVRRRRSPPGLPSDIRCHRRVRYLRRKPRVPITSRPRPPFQRHTAKRAAFQKTGMPLAATTREGTLFRSSCRRRIAPPAPSRRLSRSRRPHFVPISGESAFVGHCECHGAVTRDP
jgi:hypothetical protein